MKMQPGTTLSHPHLQSLGLDAEKAIEEIKKIKLRWIRLGCYWNEIEKTRGKYDFSRMDRLIEACGKKCLDVVISVGMKAPRWPEYYIPRWLLNEMKPSTFSKMKSENKFLLDNTLKFIERAVLQYKNFSFVKVLQIENEPLDPSGPNRLSISEDFLDKEIKLVKNIGSKKKILVNFWGNRLNKKRLFNKAVENADILGLDLYPKHAVRIFGKLTKYTGPLVSKNRLIKLSEEIRKKNTDLWLTELQAEPWEADNDSHSLPNPLSFSPWDFEKNLEFALDLKPSVILFWGFEFWYLRKLEGDPRYMDAAEKVINKYF